MRKRYAMGTVIVSIFLRNNSPLDLLTFVFAYKHILLKSDYWILTHA